MNAQEYEVLRHLKEVGAGSGKDAKVSQFDIDVIKSLELQRYIKTTPKRDMAGLTGLGLIAVTTAAEKRKRETGVSIYDTEDELAGLSDTQIAALQQLERRGAADNWVEMNIHHITRKSLEKLGLIQYDGVRYLLLDAALEKLAEVGHVRTVEDGALPKPEALPNVQSRVKPFHDSAALDNEDSQIDPTPTLPVDGEGEKRVWLGAGCLACNGTGYKNGIYGAPVCSECGGTGDNPNLRHDCGDDCEECVYREVVALLAKKHPEVGELADALLTQKKVLARLKLGE